MAIGTAVGIPSARSVKMTAMPQMVALFNGVGGGAVALISFVEFREAGGDLELEALIPILFAAIIGSISFWGSNIAFLKLQETLKRSIKVPREVNAALLLLAVALAVVIAAGSDSQLRVPRDPASPPACSACSPWCRSAAPTCPSSSRP